MSLSPDQRKRAVEFLIPYMDSETKCSALLNAALSESPVLILTQIDWSITVREFTVILVKTLDTFGKYKPGTPCTKAVLEQIRQDSRDDVRNKIDALIDQLYPSLPLNADQYNRIIEILTPHMDMENRRATLQSALWGGRVLRRIKWSGADYNFTVELVACLDNFGNYRPGMPCIRAVLEEVKKHVGDNVYNKINALVDQLYPSLPLSTEQIESVIECLIPYMGSERERSTLLHTALSGSPVLGQIDQIDWPKIIQAFTGILVERLDTFGEYRGIPCIRAVLEEVKKHVGDDTHIHKEIDDIINNLYPATDTNPDKGHSTIAPLDIEAQSTLALEPTNPQPVSNTDDLPQPPTDISHDGGASKESTPLLVKALDPVLNDVSEASSRVTSTATQPDPRTINEPIQTVSDPLDKSANISPIVTGETDETTPLDEDEEISVGADPNETEGIDSDAAADNNLSDIRPEGYTDTLPEDSIELPPPPSPWEKLKEWVKEHRNLATLISVIGFAITFYIAELTPPGTDFRFVISPSTSFTVIFSNISRDNAEGFDWDFGDGTAINSEIEPQHTYQEAGTYRVELKGYRAVENAVPLFKLLFFGSSVKMVTVGDADKDGVVGPDDLCPLQQGPAENDGCPLPITITPSPTSTQTDMPTVTPSPTLTLSYTPPNTQTDTPSPTPTTPSPTPTETNTPACIQGCIASPGTAITETFTPSPTTPSPTVPSPTPTASGTPTITKTYTPTHTPTYTETSTLTSTASNTPTITKTYTPTHTPTYTETSTLAPTPTLCGGQIFAELMVAGTPKKLCIDKVATKRGSINLVEAGDACRGINSSFAIMNYQEWKAFAEWASTSVANSNLILNKNQPEVAAPLRPNDPEGPAFKMNVTESGVDQIRLEGPYDSDSMAFRCVLRIP